MLKSTQKNSQYWRERQIDWNQAYFTPEHPHRDLLIGVLAKKKFGTVLEIGCAAGANLYRIAKAFPGVQLGGVDVSADAIVAARPHLPPTTHLDVAPAHKIFLPSQSVDVTLTDMTLIYYGPTMIGKALTEIERLTRTYGVFCEFHHPSFVKRWGLRAAGYNAYNWRKMLQKRGWYDITIYKIPEAYWPGGEPQKTFGHIIVCTR